MIPKFRVWDESIRYMDYRVRVTTTDDYIKVEVLDAFSDWRELEKRQYELMQSTGLKDKNGKEIFEGDIVHWKDLEDFADVPFEDVVKVEYSDEFMKWIGTETCGSYKDFYDLTDTRGLEVTGNIYENPELLEATDDLHRKIIIRTR